MFLTNLKRVLKTAVVNFWRNGSINIATTGIMAVTLLSISILVILTFLGNNLVENFKTKIDVSVYFFSEASEENILKVRDQLVALPEVKEIAYTSKDEAWNRFKAKYSNNSIISQGIGELDDNPLYAAFSVKAKNIDDYPKISEFLSDPRFKDAVNKVSFEENKPEITKLSSITKSVQKGGAIISLIFTIISLFVVYNAIRLTMYNYKQEVKIMRLVGAGKWYIQFPFVIEGAIYGLIGSVFSMMILMIMVFLTTEMKIIEQFFNTISVIDYFKSNLLFIFGTQVALGVTIGVLSSLFAIRKYLRT